MSSTSMVSACSSSFSAASLWPSFARALPSSTLDQQLPYSTDVQRTAAAHSACPYEARQAHRQASPQTLLIIAHEVKRVLLFHFGT